MQRSTVGRLSQIGVTTLVILGEWDGPNPLELLAAEIPGAQTVIMLGTAHHPFLEKPAQFNQIVLDFLGSLPRYNLLSPAQKKTANCHQVVFSKASKTAYSCNRPTQGYNVYHLVVKQRAEQIQPDTPGKNTEGSWNRDGEAFSIPAKGTTMTSSAPCLTARGRRKNTEKGGTKRV